MKIRGFERMSHATRHLTWPAIQTYDTLHANWNVSCKVIKRWLNRFRSFRTKERIFLEQISSEKYWGCELQVFVNIYVGSWQVCLICETQTIRLFEFFSLFWTLNIHTVFPIRFYFFVCDFPIHIFRRKCHRSRHHRNTTINILSDARASRNLFLFSCFAADAPKIKQTQPAEHMTHWKFTLELKNSDALT